MPIYNKYMLISGMLVTGAVCIYINSDSDHLGLTSSLLHGMYASHYCYVMSHSLASLVNGRVHQLHQQVLAGNNQ